MTYDSDGVRVKKMAGGITTTMSYGGDGTRVKKSVDDGATITTTYYVGNWYEKTGDGQTKYYYHGDRLVALRRSGDGLYYVHADHLGSVMLTTDTSAPGEEVAEQRFYPWGQATRYPDGGTQKTEYNFTGQRLDDSTDLLYYGARYYDPALRRFVSADTIVPDVASSLLSALTVNLANPAFAEEIGREYDWRMYQATQQQALLPDAEKPKGLGVVQWFQECQGWPGVDRTGAFPGAEASSGLRAKGPDDPQNLNRYTYVRNNPLRYVDPTGYWTFGVTFTGMGFLVAGVRGDITIAIDDKFNVGVLVAPGGGGFTSVGYNVGLGVQVTTVPTIEDLQGWAVQLGGGLTTEVVGVSGDVQFMPKGFGTSIGGGPILSLPLPAEVHGTFDYSWLVLQYNILDLLGLSGD